MCAQVSASTRPGGFGADPAPSMSQSVIFCRSVAFMRVFAAQVSETSRRCKRPNKKSDSVAAVPAADLPAMAQEMIGEHAGHHGLADPHRAYADARIVAALGHDVGISTVAIHGAARPPGRGCALHRKPRPHRPPCPVAAPNTAA